jgi:hypothetical protein
MLDIGYFSKFPAAYKDREKTVAEISFSNLDYEITKNNTILIKSSTGKYNQEIEIVSDVVSLKSPCKVFCSCESFKYEFVNSLFKSGSLLHSMSLVRSIISRPKQKNTHNIPSGCKHIVALTRKIIKLKHKIKISKE